jgi:hypothetical protein
LSVVQRPFVGDFSEERQLLDHILEPYEDWAGLLYYGLLLVWKLLSAAIIVTKHLEGFKIVLIVVVIFVWCKDCCKVISKEVGLRNKIWHHSFQSLYTTSLSYFHWNCCSQREPGSFLIKQCNIFQRKMIWGAAEGLLNNCIYTTAASAFLVVLWWGFGSQKVFHRADNTQNNIKE